MSSNKEMLLICSGLVMLLLPGFLFSQQFETPFETEINNTFIGVNTEVEEILSTVKTLLAKKNYSSAVKLLQKIIDNEYDGLVKKRFNYYVPVKEYCEEVLFSAGERAIAKYRELVDPITLEMHKKKSPEIVLRLADKYALSSKGHTFLFEAGTILFEKHYFPGALRYFDKCLAFFGNDAEKAKLLPAGYTAALLCQREESIIKWQENLDRFKGKVEVGREQYSSREFINMADKLYKQEGLKEPGAMPSDLKKIWEFSLNKTYKSFLLGKDLLFLYDKGELAALSLIAGYPVWVKKITEQSIANLFPCSESRIGIVVNKENAALLLEGRYKNTLLISGEILFLSSKTGEELQKVTVDKENSVTVFDKEPLVSRNFLYFSYLLFSKGGGTPENFIACFDLDTDTIIWDTFICQGPSKTVKGEKGGKISLLGGTLIYLTNRGVIAGIDRFRGKVEWAFRYPQRQRGRRSIEDKRSFLHASSSIVYAKPSDSNFIQACNDAGDNLWSINVSKAKKVVPVLDKLLFLYDNEIHVYSQENKREKVITIEKGSTIFPAGGAYFFQTKGKKIFLKGPDIKPQEIIALTDDPATPPENISVADRYLFIQYPGKLRTYVSTAIFKETEKDSPLGHFLSAQIAFSSGEWDKGEQIMTLFFRSAGSAFAWHDIDLVPVARKKLFFARLKRAEKMYVSLNYNEAEVWFEKALEYHSPGTRKLDVYTRLIHCYRKNGKWDQVVNTAQNIIKEFPREMIKVEPGVKVSGFKFGKNVISEAVGRSGAEVYAEYEVIAEKLFKQERYGVIAELYPNSAFVLQALYLQSGKAKSKGDFSKAYEYMQKYLAYEGDTATGTEELYDIYLKAGMQGAAAELKQSPVKKKPERELNFPLFKLWNIPLDEKKRKMSGGIINVDNLIRYLGQDSTGFYYEHGGILEKRSYNNGSLIWSKRPENGWLGITLNDSINPRGIVIVEVLTGMPAEAAGFETGDIIVGLNGLECQGTKWFIKEVKKMKPGTDVRFDYIRNPEKKVITMMLGQRPDHYLYNEIRKMHVTDKELILFRGISAGYMVQSIDKESGECLWSLDGDDIKDIAFSDNTSCMLEGERIIYVDNRTGKIIWEQTSPGTEYRKVEFADIRYLFLSSMVRRSGGSVYLIDRFSGASSFTLGSKEIKKIIPCKKGYVVLRDDWNVSLHDYRTGKTRWEVKLPFKVRPNYSVFMNVAADGETVAVWVNAMGGVFLKEGEIKHIFDSKIDKRSVTIIDSNNNKLLCFARNIMHIKDISGSESSIPLKGLLMPSKIVPLSKRYVCVFDRQKHTAVIVDIDQGKVCDRLEINPGNSNIMFHQDKIYSLGKGGMECFGFFPMDEAMREIEKNISEGTVEAALKGAGIAFKLERPFKGYTLLKPYLGTTGKKGVAVEEMFFQLKRQEFEVIPVKEKLVLGENKYIKIQTIEQYLSNPLKLKANKDCKWKGTEDLSGEAVLRYNDNGLTISVRVQDDVLSVADVIEHLHNRDCVVIGIEIPSSNFGVSHLGNSRELFFVLGFVKDDPVFFVQSRNQRRSMLSAVLEGEKGKDYYAYELFIPWKELSVSSKKPHYFKMGIMLQDDDGNGVKGEMNWTPASSPGITSFSQKFLSEYFATVVLE